MDRLIGRLILTLCVASLLGGCAMRVADHGETQVRASFFGQTLWADLDRTVRPADVHAAGRVALQQSGLTIFKDRVVGTETELAAKGPNDRWPKRVVIETRDTGVATHVWLSMRPVASEAYLRTLFDAVLRELGL